MFQPSLVLLSVLCVSNAIAMPHQAMNLARDSAITGSTSTTSGLPNSPPSTTSTGTNSTSNAGAAPTNTTSTSVPGGAQPTGPSTTTSNPPQAAPSTLTTHSTHSVGSPTGIPAAPMNQTHPIQGHPTVTMSGGNDVHTMTVRPGEWEILAVLEENSSKEIMFVEVHLSTRYGSGGGKDIQTGVPGTGGHGNATSVIHTHTKSAGGKGAPTSARSTGGAGSQATSTSSVPLPSALTPGSASTNENLNANSKINAGNSSTLCTDHVTKTKTALAGNTVF